MESVDGETFGRIGRKSFSMESLVALSDESVIQPSTSAEPDRDVLARLPCFATSSNDEASIEDAVLMLNVL